MNRAKRRPTGRFIRGAILAGLTLLGAVLPVARAEWASNRLVAVAAPGAVALSAHAVRPWLAVGREGAAGEAVRIFRLDANGQPEPRAWVTLPAPTVPAGVSPQTVADLVFHPREPLLYVRWDWTAENLKDAATRAAATNLGCVGIYRLTDTGLDRSETVARGPLYPSGYRPARIAIEDGARRLYLSNLALGAGYGLGALPLLTNGWPRLSDGEWVPVTRTIDLVRGPPNGLGFLAFSNAVLFSAQSGLATWDAGNRLAPLGVLLVRELGNPVWVGGAPELPAVYGLEMDREQIVAVAQSDGFLSGRPRTLTVAGAAFCAPPAVVSRAPRYVAAPSAATLHLVPIDATGRLDGAPETAALPAGGRVRDVKYCVRTDRLYVLQEAAP